MNAPRLGPQRLLVRGFVSLVLLMTPAPPLAAGPDDLGTTVDLGNEGLVVALPKLTPPLVRVPSGAPLMRQWATRSKTSEIWIQVNAYTSQNRGLDAPEAVTERLEVMLRTQDDRLHPGFTWASSRIVPGRFGSMPYAQLSRGTFDAGTPDETEITVLTGVLSRNAFDVQVRISGEWSEEVRKALSDLLLRGIETRGPTVDSQWTEAEMKERLDRDVPAGAGRLEFRAPIRTRHFIVFANSDVGSRLAERMEAIYEAIRSAFPFEEIEGRRLLPVFLFRERKQYRVFAEAQGHEAEWAAFSGGFASKDYYATFAADVDDPLHMHEVTHQIFRNVLRLRGAGSWFHEGVAEYMATRPVRGQDLRRVPLDEFLRAKDLLGGVGGLTGTQAYAQAASLIAFLKDGPWQPDKFQEFVRRVGRVPRTSFDEIAATVKAVYGTTIQELEAEWVKSLTSR